MSEEDKKILNNLINKKEEVLQFNEIQAIVKFLLGMDKKLEKLMPIKINVKYKESEEK